MARTKAAKTGWLHCDNCKRTTLFAATMMLSLGTAWAQTTQPMAKHPLPFAPSVDCGTPSITGEQFMQMFHAIAMHGDLWDIPFLEKTLQTTLKPTIVNAHRIIYNADTIFNSVIGIRLNINNNYIVNDTVTSNATLSITGTFECFYVTGPRFQQVFGGGFVTAVRSNGSIFNSFYKDLKGVGKNNTSISVGYQVFNIGDDHYVIFPGIGQSGPIPK